MQRNILMDQNQQIIQTPNSKPSRKNSIEAKQNLLHLWQSQQQEQPYYFKSIRSRKSIGVPQFLIRCVNLEKPKKKQQQKLFNISSFLSTQTHRNRNIASRCSTTNYESVLQRIEQKKLLVTPKINIGKIERNQSICPSNKAGKLKPQIRNRIKIVIKNCGDLKKESQRLKTCL